MIKKWYSKSNTYEFYAYFDWHCWQLGFYIGLDFLFKEFCLEINLGPFKIYASKGEIK